MAEQKETDAGPEGLSEETLALAAKGRGEEVASGEDGQGGEGEGEGGSEKPQRPDHVPEKFWDAEKGEVNLDNLLKSYTELEKTRNEKAKADEEAGTEGKEGEEEEAPASGISPELFSTAQTEWASTGELSAETRQSILDSGVPEATLDTYLAGVAALSAAMTAQVYETAGGQEAYEGALQWAEKAWSKSQIEKFNTGIDDPDLREPLIKGLMADYVAANPGEGKQTRPGGGGGDSDTYSDHSEFQKDLAKADAENDQVARRKAVEKLERSRKAKTITSNRPGMARFGI